MELKFNPDQIEHNTSGKLKCYIAGQIGNLPVEEYTENFEKAKKEVEEMGYEPVSPVDLPHNHNRSWEAYMKEDLIAMLQCQLVYALRNSRLSPGATIEIRTAADVRIPILYQK